MQIRKRQALYGQNNISVSKTKNGYSYGTGDSYADAEQARKDAAQAQKDAAQARKDAEHQAKQAQKQREDNGKSGKAVRSIFQNLINEGYISTGAQCSVAFNHNVLNVNGKKITGAIYDRIKADFERILGGKKATYAVNFTGVINNTSNDGLSLTGTMHTSIDTD
jgi:hypothetical protein